MKNIYIILTQSTSIMSRLIHHFTGETYTHVSIAFNDNINSMYSFARKYASLPLPAGLVEEHIDRGFYKNQQNIPCMVLTLSITESEYFALKTKLYNMFSNSHKYKYSIVGLLLCKFNIPFEIPKHFFCSQFVAKLLNDCEIVALPKQPTLMHPTDFLEIEELTPLFSGKLCELRSCLNSSKCA